MQKLPPKPKQNSVYKEVPYYTGDTVYIDEFSLRPSLGHLKQCPVVRHRVIWVAVEELILRHSSCWLDMVATSDFCREDRVHCKSACIQGLRLQIKLQGYSHLQKSL